MSEKEEELQEQHAAQEEQADKKEENTDSNQEGEHQFGEAETDDRIQVLEQDLLEEKNKYLRLYAEFENFRRRTAKERLELIGSATADLMNEIIPILDDFERAMESNKTVEDIDTVKNGFELLHSKMIRLLGNKGLKAMESKGEAFDPEVHEAIAQVPAQDKKEKGKIIDVAERGYKLNDKIIRHPKVVVGTW